MVSDNINLGSFRNTGLPYLYMVLQLLANQCLSLRMHGPLAPSQGTIKTLLLWKRGRWARYAVTLTELEGGAGVPATEYGKGTLLLTERDNGKTHYLLDVLILLDWRDPLGGGLKKKKDFIYTHP